jgi:hypothetical protein
MDFFVVAFDKLNARRKYGLCWYFFEFSRETEISQILQKMAIPFSFRGFTSLRLVFQDVCPIFALHF